MATLPEGLTQKDIDRYAQLDSAIKKLQDEHKALNDKIKKSLAGAGITGKRELAYPSEKYGTVTVTMGEQHRLDEAALAKAFPFEKQPDHWMPVIDKDTFDKTVLDKFRTVTVQTISVKVAE